jgi:hypothetical protein
MPCILGHLSQIKYQKQRYYLLKTSDSKYNLMKKWGNIEKAN